MKYSCFTWCVFTKWKWLCYKYSWILCDLWPKMWIFRLRATGLLWRHFPLKKPKEPANLTTNPVALDLNTPWITMTYDYNQIVVQQILKLELHISVLTFLSSIVPSGLSLKLPTLMVFFGSTWLIEKFSSSTIALHAVKHRQTSVMTTRQAAAHCQEFSEHQHHIKDRNLFLYHLDFIFTHHSFWVQNFSPTGYSGLLWSFTMLTWDKKCLVY